MVVIERVQTVIRVECYEFTGADAEFAEGLMRAFDRGMLCEFEVTDWLDAHGDRSEDAEPLGDPEFTVACYDTDED